MSDINNAFVLITSGVFIPEYLISNVEVVGKDVVVNTDDFGRLAPQPAKYVSDLSIARIERNWKQACAYPWAPSTPIAISPRRIERARSIIRISDATGGAIISMYDGNLYSQIISNTPFSRFLDFFANQLKKDVD